MDAFIESVRTSALRFSDAVRRGPLDAPVLACPGWTLADLTHHMGFIHRWARLAALTSAPPDQGLIDGPPATDPVLLSAWIDIGATALIEVLESLDPDAPTWHPFPVPRVAALWPRRQAHETLVHTWDAEHAVGVTSPLEPAMALDGIAEYFEVIAPRIVARVQRVMPVGRVAVAPVDVDEVLIVGSPDGTSITVDRRADVDRTITALHGRAEDLLLALWGRAPLPGPPADPVALEWLAFGGN